MAPRFWFGIDLTENYALDLSFLYIYRGISDGIQFWDFRINWDRYRADHKPSFQIIWAVCNLVILDLEIYNKNHTEGDQCLALS